MLKLLKLYLCGLHQVDKYFEIYFEKTYREKSVGVFCVGSFMFGCCKYCASVINNTTPNFDIMFNEFYKHAS